MNRRPALVGLVVAMGIGLWGTATRAGEPPPDPPSNRLVQAPVLANPWRVDTSVATAMEGNINHDPIPLASYGAAPELRVRYAQPANPRAVWGYAVSATRFSATDTWDRVSHGGYLTVTARPARAWRLDSSFDATWKGSPDDREIANVFGGEQRAAVRLGPVVRLIMLGSLRYKQYADDPGTSGVVTTAGGKVDVHAGRDRTITLGYRHQDRLSRADRDRYHRHTFALDVETTGVASDDRVSVGVEFRRQQYDRLVDVGGRPVPRQDHRTVLSVAYDKPLGTRLDVTWRLAFEARRSNDPSKRYVAPVAGATAVYHWLGR